MTLGPVPVWGPGFGDHYLRQPLGVTLEFGLNSAVECVCSQLTRTKQLFNPKRSFGQCCKTLQSSEEEATYAI